MVVERGDVGGVGGIGGECANHLLYHRRMLRCLYREGCCSVKVQLRLEAIFKMGGGPSRQVGLGVEWRCEGGVRPVDTNISYSMLHGSSFVRNRSGQYELRYILEEEAKVLNHEVFHCCLWASHTAFMVATCVDHVARGAVRWSTDHFSN